VIGVEEESKTVSTLDFVLETFLKQGGSRRTVVVPVGGGIVSNTYGLVAGLLFRGIRLVQVPFALALAILIVCITVVWC
jgi:3-dehydroquinate synthetase